MTASWRFILCCTALVVSPPALALEPVDEPLAGPVPGHVVRVIDGDTIRVRARIWLGQEVETNVRLRGVDTPEMHSRCDWERAQAQRATQFVEDRLTQGTEVALTDISRDKYGGRVVARLIGPDGQDLSQALLATDMAHPYEGGHKRRWCAGPGGGEDE